MGTIRKVGARAVILVCMSTVLSGCVAAVPFVAVAMWGISGFSVYKVFQSKTAGAVELGFSEESESIKDGAALKSISRPAIWPSGRAEPLIAQKLEDTGSFGRVVSPMVVAQSISQRGVNSNIGAMTESELKSAFSKVCDSTGSDSVIYFGEPIIADANKNYFSLKAPTLVFESVMMIHSCTRNRIAYKGARRLEIEGNFQDPNNPAAAESTWPPDVIEFVAEATAEKLVELISPSARSAEMIRSEPAPEPNAVTSKGFSAGIAEAQLELTKRGYDPGPIDGLWGGRTRAAIAKFQADTGLEVTGELDPATRAALGL